MASKITYRKFKFTGEGSGECTNKQQVLEVTIPEVLDPHYGMYTWPCAPVLAQYLWYNRDQVRGKSVLELGAGTSLAGIVAAKCGAKVVLSDAAQFTQCLENCRQSCQANGLEDVIVVGITWGQFSGELFRLPRLDLILASDCFYDTKDFEDVLATVYFLLDRNPNARFLCTYQERNADWSVESLLNKWHLQCAHIALSSFEADAQSIAGSGLPGNHTVWMMEVTLKR